MNKSKSYYFLNFEFGKYIVLGILFFIFQPSFSQPLQPTLYNYTDTLSQGSKICYANMWLPATCKSHIRGLILASHTLAEAAFMSDRNIRKVAEEQQLALIYLAPSPISNFAADDKTELLNRDTLFLLKALDRMAQLSGFQEINYAPWFLFGHSTSSAFVRKVLFWKPERSLGAIIYKGGAFSRPFWANKSIEEVPVLGINGEYEEYGPNGGTNPPRLGPYNYYAIADSLAKLRKHNPNHRVAAFNCIGEGHFGYTTRAAKFIAKFVAKTAIYRIPANQYAEKGPLKLKSVPFNSGFLADTAIYTGIKPKCLPVGQYMAIGLNPLKAWWFMDKDLATDWLALHKRRDLYKLKQEITSETGSFNDAGGASYKVNAFGGDDITVQAKSSSGLPMRYEVIQGPGVRMLGNSFYLSPAWAQSFNSLWINEVQDGNEEYKCGERCLRVVIQKRQGKSQMLQLDTTGLGILETGQIFSLKVQAESGLQPEFVVIGGPCSPVGPGRFKVESCPNKSGRNQLIIRIAQAGGETWAASNVIELVLKVRNHETAH